MKTGNKKRLRGAVAFITLMGVVSLFSDMTHEGARSILGEYLNLAGASGATIGFVSGVGELCGYSLRLLSGIFADKTKKYWTLVIAGYALQVLAIPALELIDARCHNIDPETQRPRKVFDTISDNAANAGVILGGRPIKPDELDLRWISALLYRNGVIEETGVAAGVLNHPANGVAWLANKLAPYDVQLEPGQIILGGSFTRPVAASRGDTFHVDYGNMGSISCRFV